jgi:hypothetical protein
VVGLRHQPQAFGIEHLAIRSDARGVDLAAEVGCFGAPVTPHRQETVRRRGERRLVLPVRRGDERGRRPERDFLTDDQRDREQPCEHASDDTCGAYL